METIMSIVMIALAIMIFELLSQLDKYFNQILKK